MDHRVCLRLIGSEELMPLPRVWWLMTAVLPGRQALAVRSRRQYYVQSLMEREIDLEVRWTCGTDVLYH